MSGRHDGGQKGQLTDGKATRDHTQAVYDAIPQKTHPKMRFKKFSLFRRTFSDQL